MSEDRTRCGCLGTCGADHGGQCARTDTKWTALLDGMEVALCPDCRFVVSGEQ